MDDTGRTGREDRLNAGNIRFYLDSPPAKPICVPSSHHRQEGPDCQHQGTAHFLGQQHRVPSTRKPLKHIPEGTQQTTTRENNRKECKRSVSALTGTCIGAHAPEGQQECICTASRTRHMATWKCYS